MRNSKLCRYSRCKRDRNHAQVKVQLLLELCGRSPLTLSSMRHLSASARAGTSLSMMDSEVCSAHRISMDPTPLPLHHQLRRLCYINI